MPRPDSEKDAVRHFWDESPCGQTYATGSELRAQFQSHASARYSLEPYIEPFAAFGSATGHDVLEIGVGMGADHLRFAQHEPNNLTGVDLSAESVQWTRKRLDAYGLTSDLRVADAEDLPFPDESFSFVYSWGVLHHSPDTQAAVNELYRVLKPGGQARVMVYNRKSLVGYALWVRYALLLGNPSRSLDSVYAQHLESPGTKAYDPETAHALFSDFEEASTHIQLSFADLMTGHVGQRHGPLVSVAKALWPRALVRRLLGQYGVYLLIRARK